MSWTDERVARLAKLWAEGLSASQIAADLGGVTRNAVIGKVHRLGLSGRAKPAGKSNAASRRKPAARPASGGVGGGGGGGHARTRQTTRTVGNTVIKVDFEEETAFEPKPIEDLVLEAKNLARNGVKELLLIAQDSTYYGLDIYKRRNLAELLQRLSEVEGIEWIRLHYAFFG